MWPRVEEFYPCRPIFFEVRFANGLKIVLWPTLLCMSIAHDIEIVVLIFSAKKEGFDSNPEVLANWVMHENCFIKCDVLVLFCFIIWFLE